MLAVLAVGAGRFFFFCPFIGHCSLAVITGIGSLALAASNVLFSLSPFVTPKGKFRTCCTCKHTFVSPSAFSRRAVVSYWQKYVHEVLVNRLGGLSLRRKSVVRLTDRPDMTLDVYRGRKTTIQQQLLHLQQVLVTFLFSPYNRTLYSPPPPPSS